MASLLQNCVKSFNSLSRSKATAPGETLSELPVAVDESSPRSLPVMLEWYTIDTCNKNIIRREGDMDRDEMTIRNGK